VPAYAEPEKSENAQENAPAFMPGWIQLAAVMGLLGAVPMLTSLGKADVQEISFQHFKTHLLAQGLVERVEVANKGSAKVYVRAGSAR
jgi:AFG3 family protein